MDEVFAVLPQSFEIVEVAFLIAEDVDDYVGVVQNCPATLTHAFKTARGHAVLFFQLFVEVFGKSLDLSFGRAAADYEVIAE